jgi:hypothetical protein
MFIIIINHESHLRPYYYYSRDCAVGVAISYGLDGSSIELGWGVGHIFRPFQTVHGVHPSFCIMGTWSFPGVK